MCVTSGIIALEAVVFPETKSYTITVQAHGYPDAVIQQNLTTNVADNAARNLALNKATITSANPLKGGSEAVDGRSVTRWESAFSDMQFITVDLGSEFKINHVLLNWENAAAKSYTVEVSTDGISWKTVYSTATGKAGINDITFPSVNARYVKMNGTARTTQYGYSLWEFEVYGGTL
ncbi:discoidin domain-containing protein [Paenibacillus psychroresistens]|uniref:Discoidin domain-containing protein n=1 Tax=Paenibacillus psychroresistens TaxID=1778678 RepID=A0A6B8RX69_9BACL|nr:discoidin domain-containing protein [Paenibacillus psychroresistens]